MIKSVVDLNLSPFAQKLFTYMYYGWLPHQVTYDDLEVPDLSVSHRTARRAVKELREHNLISSKRVAQDSARVLVWELNDDTIENLSTNDTQSGFIPNERVENTDPGQNCPQLVVHQEPQHQATLADAISSIPGISLGAEGSEMTGPPCTSILLRSRRYTSTYNNNNNNNKYKINSKNVRARVAKSVPDSRKTYTPEEEAEFDAAFRMAQAYEIKLREYTKNPYLKYLKGLFTEDRRSYQSFLRAAKLAEELGMEPKQFIEAQFYHFHEWFGREPSPHNLSGGKGEKNARWRALAYRDEVGLNHKDRLERVVSIGSVEKTTRKQRADHSAVLLQDLLSTGMTEEEIFLEYAQPGMNNFSQGWLNKQPTYRRLFGGKHG